MPGWPDGYGQRVQGALLVYTVPSVMVGSDEGNGRTSSAWKSYRRDLEYPYHGTCHAMHVIRNYM